MRKCDNHKIIHALSVLVLLLRETSIFLMSSGKNIFLWIIHQFSFAANFIRFIIYANYLIFRLLCSAFRRRIERREKQGTFEWSDTRAKYKAQSNDALVYC